jgi:eukaryotic-like serine/threonine-protein kinase
VALKRWRINVPDDTERVLEEVRKLVELDHPHVVRVLEVLDAADGVIVVMQYAPGGSLAELLSTRSHLSAGETVAVAAPLADALESAHRHGLVHGDVKPANVLFTSDGEPLLADFGGPMRGTPGYIAPEVLAGAAPDARADVYGLGIVCREALGGDVPAELAPVLDAAVANDPDDRPATASELARLLRASVPADAVRLPVLAGAVPRALGPSTREYGPRPPAKLAQHRRRAGIMRSFAAAAFVVVLVATVVGQHVRGSGAGAAVEPACAGLPLPVPAGAQVVRGDTAGIGCLASGVYADGVLTIRLEPTDAAPRRYALGLAGDRLFLGDWNCDGIATPALLRPSTGETIYFDSWAPSSEPSRDVAHCRSIA